MKETNVIKWERWMDMGEGKLSRRKRTSYKNLAVFSTPCILITWNQKLLGAAKHFLSDKVYCSDMDTDQHASPPEPHHAQSTLKHKALIVSRSYPRLEGFGAADSISFLGLSFWIVHSLHVLPELVFSLFRASERGRKMVNIYRICFLRASGQNASYIGVHRAATELMQHCTLENSASAGFTDDCGTQSQSC